MKKILVIGAGFLQTFLIKRAKELGIYVLSIDKNPNAEGFVFSDEFSAIDIVDREACLAYAMKKKVDGVITAATDYGVMTAAYIAEKMNLNGISLETAKKIKNKYQVRKVLSEAFVNPGQFYEVKAESDLYPLIDNIKYPVIVKPCDGSGSKGVRRIDDECELQEAVKNALQASLSKRVLIEDFIVGEEYGSDIFVHDGIPEVMTVMKKKMTKAPDYAELGHSVPSGLLNEEKVKASLEKAVKAIGIEFGAVNMDYLITDTGEPYIIDVGARMGGNLIGSHIIPRSTGVDYMGILLRAAIGESYEIPKRKIQQSVTTRILALSEGKIKKCPDFEEIEKKYHVAIYHHMEEGMHIPPYHNNLDGMGYIVSCNECLTIAENNADMALKEIDERTERESKCTQNI